MDTQIIEMFDKIKTIIDQNEKEVREQTAMQKDKIKSEFENQIKSIQHQADLISKFEELEPINSNENFDSQIDYLLKQNERQQLLQEAIEPKKQSEVKYEKITFDRNKELHKI